MLAADGAGARVVCATVTVPPGVKSPPELMKPKPVLGVADTGAAATTTGFRSMLGSSASGTNVNPPAADGAAAGASAEAGVVS